MRKFLLLFIATIAVGTASAQGFGFGAKMGVNISKLTKNNNDFRAGLNVGLFADYGFTRNIGIEIGAMYSQQGTNAEIKSTTNNSSYNAVRKLGYINFPVLVKIYLIEGFNVYVGPQFGVLVSAKNKIKIPERDAVYSENIRQYLTKGDVSGVVGIGYQSKIGLNIGLNYNFGFVKIDKNMDEYTYQKTGESISGRNSGFQITAGWRF